MGNGKSVPSGCLPEGACRTCGKCEIDYIFENGFLCLNGCELCPPGTFSCGDEQPFCTSAPSLCFGDGPAYVSVCPRGSTKTGTGVPPGSNGCGTEEFNFSGVTSSAETACCDDHNVCYDTGSRKDDCDDVFFQCLSDIGSDALELAARAALASPIATNAWKAAQAKTYECV